VRLCQHFTKQVGDCDQQIQHDNQQEDNPMTDLPVSQLGQYELIEKLGQGGMATVYKARQPNMDRTVAIKVLPPALRLDPEFVTRFRQEAKIIASLEHARILPVHDYGEEGDYTYLVMRYLEGNTLHQRIKQEGPFSLQEATRVMRQVAEGLQYAHSKNIIHRDMSSNNVMFDSVGNAYITDFGLAKMVAGSARLTGHSIVGTPAYVAPEQVMGERPDPRTDIYALGVVLFEMLVGDVPFQGDTPMVVIFQHVNDPLPDARDARPDLPDAVVDVITQATEKDPNNRFGSTLDMADALEQAVRGISPAQAASKPDKVSFTGSAFKPDYIEKTAARQSSTRRATQPPAATLPVVERPRSGTPGWLLPVLGIVALLLIGIVGVMIVQPSVFGLAPASTATQQAAAVPSATTGLGAATATTQPDDAPSSTAEITDEPTNVAINPTEDVPPPTLTVAPTLPNQPTVQPTGQPPAGGSVALVDAASLPCRAGEEAQFAVDFDESQPEERTVLLGPDAASATLSGKWLDIASMQPQTGIGLQLQSPPQSPHITANVAWRNGAGIFGIVASSGAPPEGVPYAFFVGPQMEIKKGRDNLDAAPAPQNLFDGQPHVIEFIVENGHFEGWIDGQMLLEGTEPNPQQVRDIAIRAEMTTVSVDYLTVCDAP
jgi:serine/threonine protein kinase